MALNSTRLADVEVEEIELNYGEDSNLAVDVDENMEQDDPEALESDEDDELDQELGLDDESDSVFSS